jgi:hypothetical protein
MRGVAIIVPSRLKAKRMVYSIPWRASSFDGGTQLARSAANISPQRAISIASQLMRR